MRLLLSKEYSGISMMGLNKLVTQGDLTRFVLIKEIFFETFNKLLHSSRIANTLWSFILVSLFIRVKNNILFISVTAPIIKTPDIQRKGSMFLAEDMVSTVSIGLNPVFSEEISVFRLLELSVFPL
jgi:hypothetical protein